MTRLSAALGAAILLCAVLASPVSAQDFDALDAQVMQQLSDGYGWLYSGDERYSASDTGDACDDLTKAAGFFAAAQPILDSMTAQLTADTTLTDSQRTTRTSRLADLQAKIDYGHDEAGKGITASCNSN